MALDTTGPRTRRALLGAGLGAVAATAASVLARPDAAAAAFPPVLLGANNDETAPTIVRNTAADPAAVALFGRVTHATGSAASAGLRGQDDGANGTGVAGAANVGATARGVYGQSVAGRGVEGASTSGIGALGHSGSGRGVQGSSTTGAGVLGSSSGGAGVQGVSTSGYGVWGDSPAGGVYGHSGPANGVYGRSEAFGASGVYGENAASGGYGVAGRATAGSSTGVYGEAGGQSGRAVYGLAGGPSGSALYGSAGGTGGFGVLAVAYGAGGAGVYGSGTDYAGYFQGDVTVTGTLTSSAPTLRLDHPGAPAARFYQQRLVGSFEQVSVVGGNAITGAGGRVAVKVPLLFARYHTDVRYQLTPLGEASKLYVAERLDARGRFAIAADRSGLEVSWQLTGVRSDPAALEEPLHVDAAKPARYRGRYVQPALYGQPRSRSLVAPREAAKHRGPARRPKAP